MLTRKSQILFLINCLIIIRKLGCTIYPQHSRQGLRSGETLASKGEYELVVQSPYRHWVTPMDHCKDVGKQGSSFLAASDDLHGDKECNAGERPIQRILLQTGQRNTAILDSSAMVVYRFWVSFQTQKV